MWLRERLQYKLNFKFPCYIVLLFLCFHDYLIMLFFIHNNNCNVYIGSYRLIKIQLKCLYFYRKSIYSGTHNFIHFNLALSLATGLIIFVSAVETMKDNKVMLLTIIIIMAAWQQMFLECVYIYIHFYISRMGA